MATMRSAVLCLLVGFSALHFAPPTQAETIRLTAVAGPAPNVTPVKTFSEVFIPEVNRRLAESGSETKIEWTEAYAQTLAKFPEVLESVEEGIAEVGVILYLFEQSKLPMHQISYMVPFGTDDVRALTTLFDQMNTEIPELREAWDFSVHLIEWTEAYAQTLAKFPEVLESVEEGIAEVGVILYLFEQSKLPMHQISYMVPFGTDDVRALNTLFDQINTEIPELRETWEEYNQVYLGSGVGDSWHLMTTFPVKRYEDLDGHKIGGSGTSANLLKNTGAVVVDSSMPQAYNAISSGLYDGYPVTMGLGFPYRIYEVATHVTKVNFGATIDAAITVNLDIWEDLPEDVQQAFLGAAQEWSRAYADLATERAQSFEQQMADGGAQIAVLPEAERARWAQVLPNVAKEWAEDLDAQGLPGEKLLGLYMEGLRALDEGLPRDWDKE